MAVRANFIYPEQFTTTVFSRKIQDAHFKSTDVSIAQYTYVEKVLGTNFVDYVLANLEDFVDLINEHITPVISAGVFVMNFYRLFSDVTDRGINTFVNQGAQPLDTEGRAALFAEINSSLNTRIAMMVQYCNEQYDLDVTGYEYLDIDSMFLNFNDVDVYGKTLKNTYL